MQTTLNQIAEVAGVSVMTVSRALANKGGVGLETRRRVLEVADQLGYFKNEPARKGDQNTKIGVLINTISEEYTTTILAGIRDIAYTAECDLIIYLPLDAQTNPDDLLMEFSRTGLDGIIYVSGFKLHSEQNLLSLNERGFPCVLVNQTPISPDILHISITDYQGAFDATKYLLQIGHRQIAFIAGQMDQDASMPRLKGYQDAMAEKGLEPGPNMVKEGDFSAQSGERAAQELLSQVPRPTAIFAASDNMAFGVMRACKKAGVRIPEDISVVGFDDIRGASQTNPPLTTVKQPLIEIGQTAMRMALNWMRNENRIYRVNLKTSLILRDSCAPYRGD